MNTSGTTNLDLKLENTTVTITGSKISSSEPIFIEFANSTLRIWNIRQTPNHIVSTKGNTYLDGYNMLDFNNNSIKSAHHYDYKEWNLIKMYPIKSLILHGNSNKIRLDPILDTNTEIKIYGTNDIDISKEKYSHLSIYNTHSLINFNHSDCESLEFETKGNGKISNLCVDKTATINMTSCENMTLYKKSDSTISETTYGTGKINWITK